MDRLLMFYLQERFRECLPLMLLRFFFQIIDIEEGEMFLGFEEVIRMDGENDFTAGVATLILADFLPNVIHCFDTTKSKFTPMIFNC